MNKYFERFHTFYKRKMTNLPFDKANIFSRKQTDITDIFADYLKKQNNENKIKKQYQQTNWINENTLFKL